MNPDETQTNNRMRPAKEKWIIGALIVLIITAAFNVARLSGFSFDVRDFAASIGLATDENIPYQGACYSEVTLTETKQDNDKISFTLAGVKSFFGKYDTLVPTYYPEDGALYIVETVDSRGTVLGQYELSSGRYLNAETFGEKPEGKMIEFQSAPTKIVLPHNPKISKLRVTEGSGGTGILSEIPFTSSTGCSPSVELRVNGNLNPDPVLYNTKMKLSYEAKGAEIRYCRPAGHHVPLDNGKVWTRLGNIYGNYNEYKLIAKHDTKGYSDPLLFEIVCYATDGQQARDTVTVSVVKPKPILAANVKLLSIESVSWPDKVFSAGDTVRVTMYIKNNSGEIYSGVISAYDETRWGTEQKYTFEAGQTKRIILTFTARKENTGTTRHNFVISADGYDRISGVISTKETATALPSPTPSYTPYTPKSFNTYTPQPSYSASPTQTYTPTPTPTVSSSPTPTPTQTSTPSPSSSSSPSYSPTQTS